MTPTERMLLEALRLADEIAQQIQHGNTTPFVGAKLIADNSRAAITAAEAAPPPPDAGLRKALELIRDDYLVNHTSKWCRDTSSQALAAVPGGEDSVAQSQPLEPDWLVFTREWVGADRYARDYEYCDHTITPRLKAAYQAAIAKAVKP